MELKYVWTKDFRVFKDFGVNLCHSGTDYFNYNGEKFEVLTKEKPVLHFGKNITSINAIAGKNGCGKSSLSELLIRSIATYNNSGATFNRPFDGILCIGNFIFYQKDLLGVNAEVLEQEGYKVLAFEQSPLFEHIAHEWRENSDQVGFVYYSNVIDLSSGNLDEFNLKNISTERYLTDDIHYGPSNTYRHDLRIRQEHRGDEVSDIEAFYIEENYHYTKFVLNFPDFFPFKEPRYFTVELHYSGTNRYLSGGKYQSVEHNIFDQLYYEYNKKVDSELDVDIVLFKELQFKLYKLNLSRILIPDEKYDDELISEFVLNNSSNDFEEKQSILDLTETFSRILEKAKYNHKYHPSYTRSNNEKSTDWRFYMMDVFYVDNDPETKELLNNHITKEEELLKYGYSFRKRCNNYYLGDGLSSGEKSFYSLFSRLYRVVKENQIDEEGKKNSLIIFIDEAEIGFHPEWKKHSLKWLVEFFNKEFVDVTVQLILTTHSPYFLSDLHNDNVILLKKDEKGVTNIEDISKKRIFAANIHELLAESFFLEDGLIGNYAKDKIERLISFLNNPDKPSEYNETTAQELIDIIGEPLIKDMLQAKYNGNFRSDDDIEAQIAELQSILKNRKQ
ncbi:AAA family ATPase [Draconibacterium sediminis]|uniref:Endonuclease GajA/Old nuclease/RecF-like AAA domain-containing protein n=1 Tax=Draconibacterium sediminis TaxID=1544798 RepID=A0A0D8JEK8_9BACT|nr:AAA family ATPase [Draconibacterium sediminis]KJF44263.1 hypothetical protein LH29_01735 [Draconibacterium sediminis]